MHCNSSSMGFDVKSSKRIREIMLAAAIDLWWDEVLALSIYNTQNQ